MCVCVCVCHLLPEQAALQEVYGDDVDLCDVLVGNLAEDKIKGFAIRLRETKEKRERLW